MPYQSAIEASAAEVQKLISMTKTASPEIAERAWIALYALDGQKSVNIARELGVSVYRVRHWRKRFGKEGIEGLETRRADTPMLRLTDDETDALHDERARAETRQERQRVDMILAAAESTSSRRVAAELDVSHVTVHKWVSLYREHGIECLETKQRLERQARRQVAPDEMKVRRVYRAARELVASLKEIGFD